MKTGLLGDIKKVQLYHVYENYQKYSFGGKIKTGLLGGFSKSTDVYNILQKFSYVWNIP